MAIPGTDKPIIGITMGDPAGIGPEIIVKALADTEIRRRGRFVVYGLNELLSYAADLAELDVFWWRDQHERITREYPQSVVVADYDEISWLSNNQLRSPSKNGGEASMQFVDDAVRDAQCGKIDALVTAPISKQSWHLAGFKYPGHTEFLKKNCRSKRAAMMFVGGPFRVVLATIHEGLFDIRNRFTIGTVFEPIDLVNDALKQWFGVENPKIAVAALNPHAGEDGQFGDEEKRIISPAILMAQEVGIDVVGPFPADTLFHDALGGKWDAIVAMYHDQGLIPIKMLSFDKAVNVTIGIPIIRTSPDHGTAFDIAGRNVANTDSMKAAIRVACDMAEIKQQQQMRTINGKNIKL
ncbi:MAG: 4-hydroxythreonine-4-phosphate dehydrogenase PdxA [Sedimentisphaerales bacterium]|nr:4-hydroxythreonine-4-phosphate dehydrogenase PdxA [Sedimentisphaerales bacterium]